MKCVVCVENSLCLYSVWSSHCPLQTAMCMLAWHMLIAAAAATVRGGCNGGHMAILVPAVFPPSERG